MAKITISKILEKAYYNFDAVSTKIATNVQSATKKELAKENSSIDADSAYENWQAQFGTPLFTGASFTIPSEVYTAIAKQVSSGIDDSVFEQSYSLIESQTIQTVANQIGTILNQLDPITVPVTEDGKKVNYVVEFTGSGIGQNVFTVRKGNLSATLTSKNSNTSNLKKAMAKYCIALYQLEHDAIKKVKKECLKIFATNALDVVKTVSRLVAENTPTSKLKKFLTTIGGSDTDSELKKFLNSSAFKQISSEYLKIEIKNALNNNTDKTTANSFDSYQTLTTYYNNLVDAVANNKNESVVKKAVDEFNTLAKSMLGGNFVKVPDPADDLHYSKDLKSVTIPSSYGYDVDAGDYESKVQKIYATNYTTSVELAGNINANIIYSGSGNDKISGGIGKDTIYSGNGNDSLYGDNDADKLYGEAGDDMLSGGDKNDTLYGGAGNDSLYGDKDADKLFGDAGNDTLVGGLGKDTLMGGDGADIFVYANGDGDDLILDYVSGLDKIKISSGSVSSYSVSGGKDAVLKVGKGKITLKGVGNNQITVITSDNRTVTYGGIANGLTFNKADLPKATAATIDSNYSGNFETGAYSSLVTVNASSRSNSISIVGNVKANKFYGGSAGDILRGGNGNDTLYGGSGNDSLYGEKDADKIYGDAGNDVLSGGDGNDTLYGGADNDSLYGEAGTDKLFGDAGNDTLNGGAGNDTLTGGAGKDVFYYTNGDGADVIADFTANEDKIYISGATSVTGSLSKNDVTFKVGKGNIKVQNAKGKEITIAYSNGTEKKYVNGVLSSSPSNPINPSIGGGGDYNAPTVVLTSSMSSPFKLDEYNKTATTKAVNIDARNLTNSFTIYGNDKNNIIVASKGGGYIYAGKGNDEIYFNDGYDYLYYYYSDGNEIVYNYGNNDRIYTRDYANIKSITLSGNDVIFNVGHTGSTTATNTITLKNAKDKYIWTDQPSSNTALGGGPYATFGLVSFSGNTAVLDANYQGNFDSKWYTANPVNINASAVTRSFNITADNRDNVIWTGKNGGTVYADEGNDEIHVNGDLSTNSWYYIYFGKGNDVVYLSDASEQLYYYYGDGNEVVYNYGNNDRIYTRDYANIKSITLSGNDVIFNVGHTGSTTATNTITLKNAKDKYICTDQPSSNTALGSGPVATFGLVNISGNTAVLDANYQGNFDSKWYTANPVNINASAVTRFLNIYADDSDNVIWTGKKGGTVYAEGGNDEIHVNGDLNYSYDIYMHTGNDVVYLSDALEKLYYDNGDGNDIVYNYGNNDQIRLDYYANIKSVTLSGNDVILNVGHKDSTTATNTITLKNAKDKYIYTTNNYSNNTAFGYGRNATFGLVSFSGNTAVLDANYQGSFDSKWYTANPVNINASAVTRSLTIYADDRENVIWTSKGYSYIYAGKGNDTIYFNDGSDSLYYYNGDGNETVYNYDIEDSIYLNSSEAKLNNVSYSGNDAILNLTSGNTITLKNAKNKAIRINGYSSGIYNQSNSSTSASVAEDYWFVEDDNFMTNSTNVDSIMEENYSVTNIETPDFNSLTNDEFTLTYNQSEKNQ